MIIGLFLGISLAVLIVSLAFITSNLSGNLNENLITGAAVSPQTISSYSSLALGVSVVIILALIIFIRRKHKGFVRAENV